MHSSDLQKQVAALAADNLKKQQEQRIDSLIRVQSANYDRAAAYTNLVTIGGYAAYFTVWGFMKDQLSDIEMVVAALSVSLSLVVFIAWEVYGMIHRSYRLRGLAHVVEATDPQEFDERIEGYRAAEHRAVVHFYRYWTVVLIFTIVPAIVGACTLLYAFLRQLLSLL